jgi:hypothetical protein
VQLLLSLPTEGGAWVRGGSMSYGEKRSNKPRTEKVLVKIDLRTALSIRIKEQQHLLGSHFLHPPISALCNASIFIKIISKRPPDYKSQEPPLLSFHNLTKLLFTNIFCSMFDGLTPQF